MGIALDRDLIEDINNPSIEIINHVISLHQKKIEKWDKLEKYYLGEHEIFNRNRDNPKARNAQVMSNHALFITDTVTGFFLGNPPSYSPTTGGNIEPVQVAYDRIDIAAHDAELGNKLSIFGECLELLYLRATSENVVEERVALIDPRQGFIVTDDSLEENFLFGVYYHEKFGLNGQTTGFVYNIYTPNNVIVYRTRNGRNIELGAQPQLIEYHFWGDVPMNEFKNNSRRQGDFEQLISLIDAFNNLQSDRISDKEAFIESVLIIYGFVIEEGENADGKGKLIEAPSKEDGASVEWLTKTFDEQSVQVLVDSIADMIHKISFVPDFSDESFHGNTTGEAMKYKLFFLLMLLANKTRHFTKGLRRRLGLMENILNIRLGNSESVNVESAEIKIKPNLPANLSSIIQQIKDSQEFIPLIHSLGWLPDATDPEDLIAQLRDQQREEIRINQEAINHEPNNRNFEDLIDEEDDDDNI